MNQRKFTDFGIEVKTRLLMMGKSQTWLEGQVSEKTGLFVDSSYMYKVLTGQRNAPKVVGAIRTILEM